MYIECKIFSSEGDWSVNHHRRASRGVHSHPTEEGVRPATTVEETVQGVSSIRRGIFNKKCL